MNENLIFFLIVCMIFYTLIPVSFPLVEAPLKILFWYSVKLCYHYLYNMPKSYLQNKFWVWENKKKSQWSMKSVALAWFCVSTKAVVIKKNIETVFKFADSSRHHDSIIYEGSSLDKVNFSHVYFEVIQNGGKLECPRLEQRSVIKFLVA